MNSQTRKIKHIQEPRNDIQFVVYPETRETLKPIVFFDAGKFTREDDGFTIGMHPHSGIGIVTYFHGTDLHHADSGDNGGVIPDGGAQWIRAGGGVWHEEGYHRPAGSTGEWTGSIHQLWLALPPKLEESEVEYLNLDRSDIPQIGQVKVLIGTYKGVTGNMQVPLNLRYLDIHLKKGETFELETLPGHATGFIFPRDGEVQVGDQVVPNSRMGILEENEENLIVQTNSEVANFIVVTSEPSPHPLVTSRGSIHTNQGAMDRSEARIKAINIKK